MNRHSAIPLAAFAALLVIAGPASAATTRYASPTGTVAGSCEAAAPCSLSFAVAVASPGDTVVVTPGSYTQATLGVNTADVDIVGQSGGAKPVLNLSSGLYFGTSATGSKLRNVAVQAGPGLPPIVASSAVTLTDLDVKSAGAFCVRLLAPGTTLADSKLSQTVGFPEPCLSATDNTTVRNVEVAANGGLAAPAGVQLIGSGISVDRLTVSGPNGVALSEGSTPGAQPAVMRRSRITTTTSSPYATAALAIGKGGIVSDTLIRASGPNVAAVKAFGGSIRNVTAVATGTGSRGLSVGSLVGPVETGPISVKNSIFRGGTASADLFVDPPVVGETCPPYCQPPPPTITNSNFRDKTGAPDPASGSNQTADPQFTDAAGGDFRPKSGSPVIDAGADDPDLGPLDLAGKQRKIGSAVDIGAFEFEPPAPPAPPAPPGPPGPPALQFTTPHADAGGPADVHPPVTDATAPVVSAVGITNKVFAVDAKATPAAARARRGTTFVYTLSEAATATVVIEQLQAGRRNGRSCVKPTTNTSKAKKCTRLASIGAIGSPGLAGPNALPFSGRIGTKALKPGSYRAVLVAVDASGNRSQPKTISFKVVRR